MTRINKAHIKENITPFANDALKIIKENLDLNDLTKREEPIKNPGDWIFDDGWYYYLHKSVAHVETLGPEIRIKRQNFRLGHTKYFKDQPKENRIEEGAWFYKEKMVKNNKGKDTGYKIDGFSVWDYHKTAF